MPQHIFRRTEVSLDNQSKRRRYLESSLIRITVFLGACVASGLILRTVSAQDGHGPNIILILADDLGWSELGTYGNQFNETPHIDSLAAEGMRFTEAYASAPVCSPYRAALLTGQHPARLGILDYLRPNSANALPTNLVTLPEILQQNGYLTGMIGKWHLTGYAYHDAEHEILPIEHGFKFNFGREMKSVGNGANFWPYVFRKQPVRWIDIADNRFGPDEYLTDRLNAEAVDFIERCGHQNRPFFLYLSHYAPHTILNGRPDLVKKYMRKHPPGRSGRDRCYLCEDAGLGQGDPGHHWAVDHNPHLGAMIESIDHGVGAIVEKLRDLNISDNTLVIFTSDNGGETNITSNAPLRGGKSELYEGGIRVPLIICWPKQVPAGTVCQQPIVNTDFYPTVLESAGIPPNSSQVLDGQSVLETWKDPHQPIDRTDLFWHYPLDRPHFLGGFSGGAVRSGEWKLVEHYSTGKKELFHLKDDVSEQKDLSGMHQKRATRLAALLEEWRTGIGATVPSPPLIAEPRQLYFAEHFDPDHLSNRLWYSADWNPENGTLRSLPDRDGNARVFLRDAQYRDAVIRFDFRLGNAQDIRLMTGSTGHYNTVLHIRPDHFFLQTAKDETVPYFSFHHGECAFQFDPETWYTMTLEFINDEAVAHLDHQHLAFAKHPIIDRQRDYFAVQVDRHDAEFDNIQILAAAAQKDPSGRGTIERYSGHFPVARTLDEQIAIQKSNAHEWHYQRDDEYRRLVQRVAELDDILKERFPQAFRSHKDIRTSIQEEREERLKNDPEFKKQLFATYRSERAIDEWIIDIHPELADLEDNRRKAVLDQYRRKLAGHTKFRELKQEAELAQSRLEEAYPHLFITDEQISADRKAAHETLKLNPEFAGLTRERAATYYKRVNYLMQNDTELARLTRLQRESQ